MATCPKCFTKYPDEARVCEVDGEALVPDAAIAAMDRDVAAGEMIGEYRVEAKLGEGGFGAVYRAVQPLIGKQVAIKVLARKLSSDPEMVSRFVAEARAVNQIQSKHIVDIFGFGALADGRQYYVMELLTGLTLEDYVHQKGFLPPEDAVPIMRSIARALDAAHAAGIVHRDLKPENVFLVHEDDGHLVPKLLDFGIAKLMSGATGAHKTRTGVPMGTPYYMSPEQCQGQKIDHKTDVYSFGVLAFQLLTGQLPFSGESFMQVMFQHVSGAPPVPSATRAGLEPGFDPPILRMLEKSPAARPETCGAAVEAIAAAAREAGHTVGTLPLGSPAFPRGAARTPSDLAAMGTAPTAVGVGASTLSAAETTTPSPARRTPLLVAAIVVLSGVAAVSVAFALKGRPEGRREARRNTATATTLALAPTSKVVDVAPSATLPAVPAQVKLTIESKPKRVEVFLGDKLLGTAPDDELRLDRGETEVELTFKADGFQPKNVKVKPAADAVVSVQLTRKGGGGAKKGGYGALEY